ncbi:MAG: hypothetical protein ACT4ON_02265 [Bacteroidota bacterium]
METVELIEPTIVLESEHIEMLNEWLGTGEYIVPFTLNMINQIFKKVANKRNVLYVCTL